MSCTIITKNGQRVGVEDESGKPSQLFQDILSNVHVKTFDEAVDIYTQTLSGKIEFPQEKKYYSNAVNALKNLQDKSVKNVQGWIKALTDVSKNGNIKNVTQELDWIGLQPFLEEYVKTEKPKNGNIPSAVVQDFILSNQVEIVEITKTTNGTGTDEVAMNDVKYENYQLKGGENYREVLLTMPDRSVIFSYEEFTKEMGKYRKKSLIKNAYDELISKGLTEKQAKDAIIITKNVSEQEIENVLLNGIGKEPVYSEGVVYKSSHWDEKNILAHIRLNDKILPDGRKVLIVNELQSDWSQSIRKSGGAKAGVVYDIALGIYAARKRGDKELFERMKEKAKQKGVTDEEVVDALQKYGDFTIPRPISMAENPYEKTDQWAGVGVRSILQLAAKEGYDGVAFATGAQSADMYDLSKSVDSIKKHEESSINKENNEVDIFISLPTNSINLTVKKDTGVVTRGEYQGKNLEDVVGKEVAKNLLSLDENEHTLSGVDLQVGGEGMKAFYDQIVPKVAQKEAQRFDKDVKIETIDLAEQNFNREELTKLETEHNNLVDQREKILEDISNSENFTSEEIKKQTSDLNEKLKESYTKLDGQYFAKDGSLSKVRLLPKFKEQDKLTLGKQSFIPITEKLKAEISQGIPLFSLQTKESPLRYQAAGQMFSTYSTALQNTNTGKIAAGVQTLNGFKPLFTVDVNTNTNVLGGMINNLVKENLLSGETYLDTDGKTVFKVKGNSAAKKAINSDIAVDSVRKNLGIKAVRSLNNGDIIFDENRAQRQIAATNKKGETVYVNPTELETYTWEQLKSNFPEDAVTLLATREFKNATSVFGEPIEEITLTPENELQRNLLSLLQKMGVRTMAISDYVTKYGKKNNTPPSAQALADMANNIVAFKDGVITQDTLTEETAHFIVAATDEAQKTDLKRNIHKTPQWTEYQQSYREIYGQTLQGAELEDAVREEILGKVLSEALQGKFAAETETQKGILNKIIQIFTDFFNKISAYFNPSFQTELNNYSNSVYANLMNDSLGGLDLNKDRSKLTLFSVDRTKNDDLTLLYNKSAEALDILTAQQNQLAKGRKLSGTREELKDARALNERVDDVSKVKALAGIVAVAKKQLGHLERAVQQNKNNGFPFSQEENAVYQTFTNHTEQLLSEIRALLNPKNKEHVLIKKELEEVLKKSAELKGKVGIRENTAITTLMDKLVIKHNLTDKERADIEAIMKASQKDTSFFQANLGTLIHARNPYLNMAGDIISRTTTESRRDYLANLKKFTNALEESKITPDKLKALKDGNYLVSEIDFEALNAAENEVKRETYNRIKNLKLSAEEFKKLDDANELILDPNELKNYNIIVNEEISKWKEQFFTDEYINSQSKENFEIAVDFHKKDRAMRAEIRAGATVNGRTIYNQNDKTELEQLNKKRAQAMNPRDPQGNLKRGLIEVYNNETEKYEIELDEQVISVDQEGVRDAYLAFGLTTIANDIRKQFEGTRVEQDIPQAFLDEMNKLDTVEDKLEFMYLNAYVGFPDSYWENFGTSKSLLQKLENVQNSDNSEDIDFIIKQIRKHQQRIAGIQKGNRVFNSPAEVNYSELTLEEKNDVKDAAQELEALYQQANKYLEQEEQEDVENVFETRTNFAYQGEIEDRGITTQNEELSFIQQHVTFNNRRNIDRAIDIAEKLKKGSITEIPKSLSNTFDFEMTESQVDEALLNYAKSKLLPYFKRTEPIGFTQLMDSVKAEETSIEEMLSRKDLIKVSPNFSFYDNVANTNINPVFLENKAAGRAQIKRGMFESQKFKDLFGAIKTDPQGIKTAEKNQDLYKAYTALIELQKTTLENYGLDGKHNIYKLPQIGKRGLRQAQDFVQDASSRPWKEILREMSQFRSDEMEYGADSQGNAATKKMRANIVPMYYTRNLEDQKDVTDELLFSYSMMNQQSSLYKARLANIGDMLSIKQSLLNSDIIGKSAEASNAYKMFSSFLDHGFFGIKETFSYQADIFGYKVDLAKVARGFNKFIKTVNLTGLTIPIISWTTGEIQRKIESVVGERINPIASKLGNKEFLKLFPEAAGEVLKINSKAKLNVLGESYGMYLAGERFENSNYSKFTRGFMKSAQITHELFNFPLLPRVLLTNLLDHRYIDGKVYNFTQFTKKSKLEGLDKKIIEQQWKSFPLLYDDIYVEKGVQKYDVKSIAIKLNRTEQDTEEYLKELHTAITNRVKISIQDIDSMISEEDKSLAARSAISSFFLTHKGWLTLAIQRKFKDKHYNMATGLVESGNWLSTYQLLKEMTADYKKSAANSYLEHIKQVWENSDETTRRNLNRTLAEIGFVNIMVALSILLSNYLDDDEDSPYALRFADYMLYRTVNEQISSGVTLPQQVAGILDAPIVGIDRLYDIKDYADFFNTDTLPNDSTTTRQWRMIVRSVPGMKDYDRLTNIKKSKDTYQHFNADNFNYSFTYYLLSKEK